MDLFGLFQIVWVISEDREIFHSTPMISVVSKKKISEIYLVLRNNFIF